jgi:hypothetical protein
MHILGEMAKALGARAEAGAHAPRIETIKIPTDKIREVIGTGGKVIREIVEKTGAKVDIDDDGTIKIARPTSSDRSGDQVDQVGIVEEAGSRQDLQRQGREDRRFRRLRELLRRQGRPRPRLRAATSASKKPTDVVSRKATGGEGQAARLRRPRQGPPVDEASSTRKPAGLTSRCLCSCC